MRLLCIDTSTEACSAAVHAGGQIYARFVTEPRAHADLILDMVAAVMDEAKVPVSGLHAVAFGCGPGSFTGIRIGTSVALAIAFAHEHPVIPVSCLATLAQGAIREQAAERVVTAMDARMGEVYWGLFERQCNRAVPIAAERVCQPNQLDILPPGRWFGVGSAWSCFASSLRAACGPGLDGWQAERYPEAADMVPLAAHELASGHALAARDAQPVYLRNRVTEKRGVSG